MNLVGTFGDISVSDSDIEVRHVGISQLRKIMPKEAQDLVDF